MAERFTHGMGTMHQVEPRIAAALRDVLARPGSLVRSTTAYQIASHFGLSPDTAQNLACGIEYLHTASLIFDDLPAMDNARTRRGAPCIHISHGESFTILAALALINRAYAMLWKAVDQADPQRRTPAADWTEARLGIHGVIGGQAHDLSNSKTGEHTVNVSMVAARKTGDLLRLTIVLPAILGKATPREIQLLDRLAILRGLAYQAADDIKDATAHESASGKTSGRDAELGRPNLVSSEGLPAAVARFHRLRRTADRAQSLLPGPPDRWAMLDLLRTPIQNLLSIQAMPGTATRHSNNDLA